MVIPEINMLCDFEAGIKCLQNPSTISRFFSFPGFWKYGALIFAIFATFSSLIRRIKLIFIRFHTVKPCFTQIEDEFDFSDDEDDVVSAASSDDEEEGEEDRDVDGDFCVRGSIHRFRSTGQLRRRRSSCGGVWSEFASGKNVVKLWDSLGFNLDLDEDLFNYDSNSVVSTWNRHREEKSSDFSGEMWLTAESNARGDGVVLGGYDRRMRSGVPALVAEWKLPAAGSGGVGKVYVRDDVSGAVAVGDVRNVRRPLECVRESDGETWWDVSIDVSILNQRFMRCNCISHCRHPLRRGRSEPPPFRSEPLRSPHLRRRSCGFRESDPSDHFLRALLHPLLLLVVVRCRRRLVEA